MRYAVLITLGIACLLVALNRLNRGPEDAPADLEFWCYGQGGAKDRTVLFWAELAKRFEAENPGVKIKLVSDIKQQAYLSMLTTRFIGGNPPDVMTMDDGYVGQLAHEGRIMSLEAFIRNDPVYRSEDFPPSMVRDSYVGNERYSIPLYAGFGCLFYRTDLFAQAGVQPPRTWDELIQTSRTLQTRLGVKYPFAFEPLNGFATMPWVWQNGGDIVSPDGKQITVDAPEVVEALSFMRSLLYDSAIADPALARGAKPTDMWSSGAAAMIIAGSWDIGRFDGKYPQWIGKWNAAPLPVGRQKAFFIGGQHLIMSKNVRNPQLAWKFMTYAMTPENQMLYADIDGSAPGNLRVYDVPEFRAKHPQFLIAPKMVAAGRNNSFAPFFPTVWYEQFRSGVLDVVMPDPKIEIAPVVRKISGMMQQTVDSYWTSHDYFIQGAPAP